MKGRNHRTEISEFNGNKKLKFDSTSTLLLSEYKNSAASTYLMKNFRSNETTEGIDEGYKFFWINVGI